MEIKIHRGSNEIGGTCIQLSTPTTTILLDLGLPLSKESLNIDLSMVKIDAVLISHPHQDHYGLIDMIDRAIPVYIGEVGKNLIDVTRIILKKERHSNVFKSIKCDKTFSIGDFVITPYLVDHSAVDAYSFLLEADGKRLFYSGDFRAHGRKSVLFSNILKNPPKDIDLLFMEGTMMQRDNKEFPSEESVEDKIYEVLKDQNNISFLISSSQNIDRIVSGFRACLRSNKILVIDLYTALVLEEIKNISKRVPAMDWDKVRVYADYRQDETIKENQNIFGDFRKKVYKFRITKEELIAEPSKYLYYSKMSKFRIMDLYKKENPINVIYSQWRGYLNCSNDDYFGAEEISTYRYDKQVNFIYAHTSGHATLNDLKAFARALNPKIIIPIHTEYAEKFKTKFDNVMELKDRQAFTLI